MTGEFLWKIFNLENWQVKILTSFGVAMMWWLSWNEVVAMSVMFWACWVLFMLDWILWTAKAKKYNIYSSDFAFRPKKFIEYGLSIIVAYCLFLIFKMPVIIYWVFWLIWYREVVSILENMSELWFKIARPLLQILKIHKNKFFNEKIRNVFTETQFFNYQEDIDRIKRANLRTTPVDYRLMYEYNINLYEDFLWEIFTQDNSNKEQFLLTVNILLKTTKWELVKQINKTCIPSEDKARFMRWYARQENALKNYINQVSTCETCDIKWLVNWVYQFILRLLYAWMFDILQKSKYDNLELSEDEINLIINK